MNDELDRDSNPELRPNTEVSEHQKAAALMAMDIDLFYKCAEDHPDKALKFFEMLRDNALEVQTNEECRNMRYEATCRIFGAAQAGLIQSTKIG